MGGEWLAIIEDGKLIIQQARRRLAYNRKGKQTSTTKAALRMTTRFKPEPQEVSFEGFPRQAWQPRTPNAAAGPFPAQSATEQCLARLNAPRPSCSSDGWRIVGAGGGARWGIPHGRLFGSHVLFRSTATRRPSPQLGWRWKRNSTRCGCVWQTAMAGNIRCRVLQGAEQSEAGLNQQGAADRTTINTEAAMNTFQKMMTATTPTAIEVNARELGT